MASRSGLSWTAGDVPSVMKGGAGIVGYAVAGFASIPYAVRGWWSVVDYDGDVPLWTIVVLERISFLFMGAIPFGLAVAVAVVRGHVRGLSVSSVLAYAVGAGILWKGMPLVLGAITGGTSRGWWVVGMFAIALAYYGLIVGLARLRERPVQQSPTEH